MNTVCAKRVLQAALSVLAAAYIASSVGAQQTGGSDSGSLRNPGNPPLGVPEKSRGLWSPLGLPRLRATVPEDAASPLTRSMFVTDELVPDVGSPPEAIRSREKEGIRVLDLRAGHQWRRPLVHEARSTQFISLLVYPSLQTSLQVGAAQACFTASPISGHLQLEIWQRDPRTNVWSYRPAGLHVPLDGFEGKPQASVPVLTFRLDAYDKSWDLYSGMCLLVAGVPYPDRPAKDVVVTAGVDGSLVSGLVQSAENPLYEDTNENGIDDRFERMRNHVLPVHASGGARLLLAQEWRTDQRRSAPAAMLVERLTPDGAAASAAQKGGRP